MANSNFSLPFYLGDFSGTQLYGQSMGAAQPVVPSWMQPAAVNSPYQGVMNGYTQPAAPITTAAVKPVSQILPNGGKSMWDGFLGTTDKNGLRTDGWGMTALSAATGLFNGYMGMKQYGLAKDQLNFQKDAFYKNYEAQKSSINSSLEDRQRARVASNSSAYQSVGDYMNKFGVK